MLLSTYDGVIEQDSLHKVVDALENDGVIIIPTDTFFAFACDIKSNKAVHLLAQLKNKKLEKANFSILCCNISQASEYTKPISDSYFRLLKKHLPGPFTFVFQASNKTPKIFQNKKRTIGIRIPACRIACAIAQELGRPLLVSSLPSDNRDTEDYSDPELIEQEYGKKVSIVVYSEKPKNIPSTVVDCTAEEPSIIRNGLGILEI